MKVTMKVLTLVLLFLAIGVLHPSAVNAQVGKSGVVAAQPISRALIPLSVSLPVPIDQIPVPTYIYGGDASVTRNFSYSFFQLFGGCSWNTQSGDVVLTDSSFQLFGPNIGAVGIPMSGLVYDDGSAKIEILRKSDRSHFFFYKYSNRVSFRVDLEACTAGGTTYGWIRITIKGRKVAPTATVTLGNLNQIFDGTAKQPTASTTPAGLPIVFVYSSSPTTCISGIGCEVYGLTPPVNAGSYPVVASLRDPNYQPMDVRGTLVISKAPATITLSNLNQSYDGNPKRVTAETAPVGLSGVEVLYDGSASPPVDPGKYLVTVSINNPNYQAQTAKATLSITGPSATVALRPSVSARGSTWIGVNAPFIGDTNHNGYTLFEIQTGGVWLAFSSDSAEFPYLSGDSQWRGTSFTALPNTTYLIRVTFFDPDGVIGPNSYIFGPITTPPAGDDALIIGAATISQTDTELSIELPFNGDGNKNSSGTFEVATNPNGPWTLKGASLPFFPKIGRIRGLTPGVNYWVRINMSDPDGVIGRNSEVLGPFLYIGLPNLALGKPVTADAGWGCCVNPAELTDGIVQYESWQHGYAFTGGLAHWNGGEPGWKQATIDLGKVTSVNRAVIWYHNPQSVPTAIRIQSSNDGFSWTDLYSGTAPVCRTETVQMPGAWYYPACAHDIEFAVASARFIRYNFDDRTLFNGYHEWISELELFNAD